MNEQLLSHLHQFESDGKADDDVLNLHPSRDRKEQSVPLGRTVFSNQNTVFSKDLQTQAIGTFETDTASAASLPTQAKQALEESRTKMARLLGLVGAPPLEWRPHVSTRRLSSPIPAYDVRKWQEQCDRLVAFVHGHVQLLLTIDEAYRWLRISASLHLGLGPHSQSVERVERATVAKCLRQQRRPQGRLEPLLNAPHSVLSLSGLRQHIAQVMVQQSDSLWELYDRFSDALELANLPIGVYTNDVNDRLPILMEIPRVVDLAWIKAARNSTLSRLLSLIVDQALVLMNEVFLVTDDDSISGFDDTISSFLNGSTSNAKWAKEYLSERLLLRHDSSTAKDPHSSTRLPTQEITNGDKPLVLSLTQYRDQLDALLAAVWSCQYCAAQPDDDHIKNNDHVCNATDDRQEWWDQIQQLSSICRALESDIGRRYFAVEENNASVTDENTDDADVADGTRAVVDPSTQPQCFEHGANVVPTNTEQVTPQTKTMIYRGRGEKETKKLSKQRTKKDNPVQEDASTLPPRDTMSEFLMVQELQRRIAILEQPEEAGECADEDQFENDMDEAALRKAKFARTPTAPLFLGVSGSLLNELKLALPASSAPLPSGSEEENFERTAF